MSTMAVTGHRPHKLWGYDLHDPSYIKLAMEMRTLVLASGCTHFISGMALGVDTLFALVVLKLKEQVHPFTLELAIPCAHQESKWNEADHARYLDILHRADKVTMVNNEPYNIFRQQMQRRNEYMVDHCDVLLAIWDGTPGGTANCVTYAVQAARVPKIIYISPRQIAQ